MIERLRTLLNVTAGKRVCPECGSNEYEESDVFIHLKDRHPDNLIVVPDSVSDIPHYTAGPIDRFDFEIER